MLDKLKKKYISKLSLLVILFVFVITLMNSVISSLISANIIRKETGNYNLLFLNRLNTLIDNEANSIDKNLLRFCQKSLTMDNITSDLSGYYERYLLSKKIDSLAEQTDYINSVYIYFDNGNKVYYHCVVSGMKSDGIKDTRDFFDRDLYSSFADGSSLSQITSSRQLKPDYAPDSLKNGSWVISFVKRLSINDAMSKNVIVININTSHFLDMIRTTNMPKGSAVVITGENGETLLTYSETADRMLQPDDARAYSLASARKALPDENNSFTAKILNENCYVTKLRSASDGKTYMLIIPEKELLKSVTLFNTSMFIVASTILVLGFIFARAVDSRFFQPIIGILSKLKNRDACTGKQVEPDASAHKKHPASPAATEFKQINIYIDDMITRNLKQEEQLRSYFSSFKDKMLLSLLNGDSETIRLIHEEKIIIGSELKSFCVVVTAYGKNENAIDDAIYRNYISNINLKVQNSLSYFGKVEPLKSSGRTVFLLNTESGVEPGEIKERLYSEAFRDTDPNVPYFAGIGVTCANMQGICSSYMEALKIAEQMESLNRTGLFDIGDIKNGESCSYPSDIEDALARHISSDQADCMMVDVRRFFFELKKNAAHIDDVKKLTFRLVYNISRKLEKSRAVEDEPLLTESVFGELHHRNTLQDIEEWLAAIFSKKFAKPAQEADTYNKEMIEKVMKYIQTHYMEDIGLNTIAYHVYLSPSYLSKLFREASGQTFTEYLIKVRMEAAAKLLLDKEANISSIVGKVGYFSAQSFCRLFKNYFKCSPSEYRRRFAATGLDGEASGGS
jgi:AraC-like DNA-binding protein